MPEWGWILIAALAVIAVVAIAIAARASSKNRRSQGLQQRFGPEYEHVVRQTGDPRAAENELIERERKHKKLDIVPLTDEARSVYAGQWRAVQTAFVDNPAAAVGDADRLVSQVMHERGYPVEDFEQRAEDISVDHPTVVHSYRAAHHIHLAQGHGEIRTEDQREAFVHYRTLFEKLLESDNDAPKEARA